MVLIIDYVVEISFSLRQDGSHLIKAFSNMKQGLSKKKFFSTKKLEEMQACNPQIESWETLGAS